MKVEDSHIVYKHTVCRRQHSQGFSYFIDHYECKNCSLRITGSVKESKSHGRPFITSTQLLTGCSAASSLGLGPGLKSCLNSDFMGGIIIMLHLQQLCYVRKIQLEEVFLRKCAVPLEVPTLTVLNSTIVFVPVTHFLGHMMCKHISSLQCLNSVLYYCRLFLKYAGHFRGLSLFTRL